MFQIDKQSLTHKGQCPNILKDNMEKQQLKHLVETLNEVFMRKNKFQKNKTRKNKTQKNKTRKPKKLREEEDPMGDNMGEFDSSIFDKMISMGLVSIGPNNVLQNVREPNEQEVEELNRFEANLKKLPVIVRTSV